MKRKFYADEVMHIYQRTVSGFNIFYSAEDFLVFYTLVSVYARRYDIVLLGLCQMIDHIHLLGTSRNLESMSRFISAYTSQYVKEFNRRTGRTGKLFEKEYGSAIKKEIKKNKICHRISLQQPCREDAMCKGGRISLELP